MSTTKNNSKASTSKDRANIDTTLNQLENVTYLKNSVPAVEKAKERIASFVDWFTFELRREFTLDPDMWDYDEIEFVLRQLKTNARAMYKYFKKIKGHEEKDAEPNEDVKRVQLPCGICNKIVAVNRGVHFWPELQQHEHFEQMLSQMKNGTLPMDQLIQQLANVVVKEKLPVSINKDTAVTLQSVQTIPSCSGEKLDKSVSSQVLQKVCASNNTTPISPYEHPVVQSQKASLAKVSREGSIESHNDENTLSSTSTTSDEQANARADSLSLKRSASPPLNTFRFGFKVTYASEVQSKLYPEAVVRNAKKVDRVSCPTIMRSGPARTICLLCGCDIIGKKSQSRNAIVNNIINHCMGQKHIQSVQKSDMVEAVKKFHDTFINLEDTGQAHQVFFRPLSSSNLNCVLCRATLSYKDVQNHIEGSAHKNYLLELYRKNKSPYYLTELQVKHYGEKFLKKPEVKQQENQVGENKSKNGEGIIEGVLKKVKRRSVHVVNQTKSKNDKSQPAEPKVAKKDKKDKNGKQAKKSAEGGGSTADGREKAHNIILSIPNLDSENVLERLPHRFANHLPFLENRGKDVYCNACSFTCIAPTLSGLIKHLYLQRHLNLTKIEIVQYAYFCEICNSRFDTELSWEEHFKAGQNKHDAIGETRKSLVHEYECTVCKTIIFGDELSLERHKATDVRKKERFRKDVKLPENVKRFLQSSEAIKREGNLLSEEANSVIKEDVNTQCCFRLEQVLREVFRNCKAYPFGSRCSGLGNWNSDLDVFIDTGDMYKGYRNQDFISQQNFVRTATKILNRYKNDFVDVLAIPTARTPIIKLYHVDTDLDCDISFKHGLSVENTKFLRFCLLLQPIAQPFILLLKRWSELCKLNDYLTTYALAIMAIFFLQVNGYLLSVKKLREINPGNAEYIDGWETVNYKLTVEETRHYIKMYDNDVVTLLKDFFQYYATFSYDIFIICPLMGVKFPRKWFTECPKGSFLPPEMHTYVDQLKDEDAECLRVQTPICVQDPFDLSHNLTKAISVNIASKLKSLCNMTHNHLESIN